MVAIDKKYFNRSENTIDFSRLESSLLDSKIQDSNNAEYQVIKEIIKGTKNSTELLKKKLDKNGIISLETQTSGILPIKNGGVFSNLYTPDLTLVANLDAATANVTHFVQMGSVVTVSGIVNVDPTAAATSTMLGISLPVKSRFLFNYFCGGTAVCPTIAGESAAILGDTANNRAEMEWISGATITAFNMVFSFSYRILVNP